MKKPSIIAPVAAPSVSTAPEYFTGIDYHKRYSVYCVLNAAGRIPGAGKWGRGKWGNGVGVRNPTKRLREMIFRDEDDLRFFLHPLSEACERTGWRVHA